MNDTIELLRGRRSAPPVLMTGPGPSPEEIETLLTLAARVPDHGKLAPWRFLLFEGAARDRAGAICAELFEADETGAPPERKRAESERFSRAPLVIGVISRARPHFKIPEWEQVLSGGAVCMNLVVAANALGYRTAWLTEWFAYDARFRRAIGLAEDEKILGFIHIGRVNAEIEDRPRPALADIVSRFPA